MALADTLLGLGQGLLSQGFTKMPQTGFEGLGAGLQNVRQSNQFNDQQALKQQALQQEEALRQQAMQQAQQQNLASNQLRQQALAQSGGFENRRLGLAEGRDARAQEQAKQSAQRNEQLMQMLGFGGGHAPQQPQMSQPALQVGAPPQAMPPQTGPAPQAQPLPQQAAAPPQQAGAPNTPFGTVSPEVRRGAGILAATGDMKGAVKMLAEGAEDARTTAGQRAQANATADIVTEDVDRAIKKVEGEDLFSPATGLQGQLLSGIGGTRAADVDNLLTTIRANAGFDKLQQMRQNSKTGAALGPVSDFENRQLQATIGSLSQSQTQKQLVDNLKRVKNKYLDIVHGVGNGPPREKLKFRSEGPDSEKSARPPLVPADTLKVGQSRNVGPAVIRRTK